MSLKVKPIQDIGSKELDSLINQSSTAWFESTHQWRQYTLNMRESGSVDLSFGVYQDEKLVGFSQLIKELIFNSKEKDMRKE